MLWDLVPLGDLAAGHNGAIAIGPFGSAMKADTYTNSGVSVIRGTNISDTRAWKGDWVYIPDALADSLKRCMVFRDDLVLPHRGSIGEVAIVPEDQSRRYFISSSLMKITLDTGKIDPLFCYYFLRSSEGRAEILRFSSSVGTPGIGQPLTSLRQVRVPVPPLTDQRAIAGILGALDDKIELNRKMNATLEAMARALFRDWFVDFGPTRAKMEGREPYLCPDLWELFPDRLDNEGKPEGWEVGTLSKLCEVTIGGLWGNDAPTTDADVQFSCLRGVDIQSLREMGTAPKTPQRFAKSTAIEKRAIRSTDVLLASSGAGPCGRSLWVGVKGFFEKTPVTYSNFVKRLSCPTEAAACFVDRTLFEMRQSGQMHQFIIGTSVPNLNDRGLLDSHPIVIPDNSLMSCFRDFMSLVQAHLYSGESDSLAQTRDLLLPRLMSGELRVAELETAERETAA